MKRKRKLQTNHPAKRQDVQSENVRIASWNLKGNFVRNIFARRSKLDKIKNVVLSINPDVIVLQEISSSTGNEIRCLLNQVEPQSQWQYSTMNRTQSGYLWKKDRLTSSFQDCEGYTDTIQDLRRSRRSNFVRTPLHKQFTFICGNRSWEFTLVNFHLSARCSKIGKFRNNNEVQALHNVVDSNNTILIGDFNAYPCNDSLNVTKQYVNIFRPTEFTNRLETDCYDNIVVHQDIDRRSCGHKVVKNVSTQPITFTGSLQPCRRHCYRYDMKRSSYFDHFPICAEFSIPQSRTTNTSSLV